jgi:L-iditol 2-dehydrogenase
MPALACGNCSACRTGATIQCSEYRLLGLDRDGAFAEAVVVPAAAVYRLPDHVSFAAGAYTEPVAAALGVLDADLPPRGHGLLFGDGRFVRLVEAILHLHGFRDVSRGGPSPTPSEFDFVIETGVSAQTMPAILDAVRPGGIVVLRSRPPEPVPLDVSRAIRKRVRFVAVNYGSFSHSLALVSDGRLPLQDILGDSWPLEAFETVFARARGTEERKLFFALAPTTG